MGNNFFNGVYNKGGTPTDKDKKAARIMTAQGWRRVSNNYQHVARVDRPDWLDVLAVHLDHSVSTMAQDMEYRVHDWSDSYRRSRLCKSRVVQNGTIFKLIPGSGHCFAGYVELGKGGKPLEAKPVTSLQVLDAVDFRSQLVTFVDKLKGTGVTATEFNRWLADFDRLTDRMNDRFTGRITPFMAGIEGGKIMECNNPYERESPDWYAWKCGYGVGLSEKWANERRCHEYQA